MLFLLFFCSFHITSGFLTEESLKLSTAMEKVLQNATGHQSIDWMDLLDIKHNIKADDSQCFKDITAYRSALNTSNPLGIKTWALKMFDATGKAPAPGIFLGSSTSLPGNYESCLEVDSGAFVGRYFLSYIYNKEQKSQFEDYIRLTPAEKYLALSTQPGRNNPILQQLYGFLLQRGSTVGICMPSSCSSEEVNQYMNYQLASINKGLFTLSNEDINTTVPWTSGDKAALAIVLTLLACILIGSIVDIALRHGADSAIPTQLAVIFQGFSVYTVLRKIFNVSENKDGLGCINGIRFWSMVWVIVGHSYLSIMQFGPFVSNPLFFGDLFEDKSMRLLFNATESVDSFFMIGGCLLTYLTLREVHKLKGGSVKFWIMYYVHRYIRLTGAYAGIIMLSATLIKFMPHGAKNFWDTKACSEDWYTNILYYNNYQDDRCLGQTWYLAVEMQCFLITPFLILLMYLNSILGNLVTGGLVIASTLLRIWAFPQVYYDDKYDSMNNIYVKPWYRFCSYGVGLILGSILFSMKGKSLGKGKVTRALMTIGWAVSLTTIFMIIFGYDPDFHNNETQDEYVVYQTLFRTCWSLALAFIVFASAKGYGGPIGGFLEWGAFAPLAKMTYSAYLIHFLVLAYFNTQINYNIQLSQAFMAFYCITNVIVSMAVGLATTLVFEAPVVHLEKLLFGYLGIAKLPAVNKYKLE